MLRATDRTHAHPIAQMARENHPEFRMSSTVRRAGITDISAVAPLFDAYRTFYGKSSDIGLATRFLAERLTRDESVLFLATDTRGIAIGFTQLYPLFSSVRAVRTYLLNDLFVAPDARRSGAAQALLDAAADFARDAGAASLSLSTALTNAPAQRLYEARGWIRDDAFCEYSLTL